MAVGVAKQRDIHKAIAKGDGNIVLYLGAKTGRDGVHGATMASEEFGEGNEERRPTVQVGDPFTEKLVMESCLEMMKESLLVGIQDMGAAGITCSTFEMASRGGVGIELDLDQVPLRDSSLTAYEIFLSESQERMLLVAEKEQVVRIKEIAEKWDVECHEIGKVIHESRIRAHYKGESVIDLPVAPLTDEAPIYERPFVDPVISQEFIGSQDLSRNDLKSDALKLLNSPNLASRRPIFEQYDYSVGTDTVLGPGANAAVMRIKGLPFGIALTVDSNSSYCKSDPFLGAQHVVAESIRNLACVGAKGVAVTNCLKFW